MCFSFSGSAPRELWCCRGPFQRTKWKAKGWVGTDLWPLCLPDASGLTVFIYMMTCSNKFSCVPPRKSVPICRHHAFKLLWLQQNMGESNVLSYIFTSLGKQLCMYVCKIFPWIKLFKSTFWILFWEWKTLVTVIQLIRV